MVGLPGLLGLLCLIVFFSNVYFIEWIELPGVANTSNTWLNLYIGRLFWFRII